MNLFASNSAGLIAAFVVLAASAGANDVALDIPHTYQKTAALYDIPPDIFYAIALQESGRHVKELDQRTPWPWTLNVAGHGYYFNSQAEAWDALRGHVEKGRSNIGVGLMQVTWPYNQYALVDVYSALDPATNLRLGAQILRACYDRLGDWWAAVGCYHSPGSSEILRARADAYIASVKRRWRLFMTGPSK